MCALSTTSFLIYAPVVVVTASIHPLTQRNGNSPMMVRASAYIHPSETGIFLAEPIISFQET